MYTLICIPHDDQSFYELYHMDMFLLSLFQFLLLL